MIKVNREEKDEVIKLSIIFFERDLSENDVEF